MLEIAVLGAVLSIFTAGALVAELLFPALSETDVEAVRPVPSLLIVLSAGHEPSSPDKPSLHVQCTATFELYQPAPLGDVVGAPEIDGATLSMLMPATVAEALLSALSVALPVTDWLAAEVDNVVGPLQLLMPDGLSLQVKDTVTSVLFQPLAFAAGLRLPVMVGPPLSSFTVTDPFPTFPNLSVAAEVSVTPNAVVFAFSDWVAGVGPLATPEPASVALQVMDTLELFQPAAFGAGDSAAVTVGPVLSRTKDALCGLCDWPVQLLALKLGEAAAVTV
jgi:hypothetical protein